MPFAPDRYDSMLYRRCGRSGLKLPAISLGGWQAIGSYSDDETAKRIFFRAFDCGITHFDLANVYGTPPGTSEALFGRILTEMPRDELVISSKAGGRMWPGPYGEMCSRKHIIESCDQSLKRIGVERLDIFYLHRYDAQTPLEESISALEHLIRQGKVHYAGISNFGEAEFLNSVRIVSERQWSPITIVQPLYNMMLRGCERSVLPTAGGSGVGVIVYSPLAQGLLSDRYLDGEIPADSRAAMGSGTRVRERVQNPENLYVARALREIARARGQTLSQMALAWLLKDERVTSVLIGASKVEQLDENLGCLKNLVFSADELAAIEAVLATGTPW